MTDTVKRCSACHEMKAIEAFYRRQTSRDGIHTVCKECLASSNRAYLAAHRGQIAARKRERRAAQDEAAKAAERLRQKAYNTAHRESQNAAHRSRRLAIKLAVLRHYGPACSCCGEYDSRLLSIEHANGDGAAHRRLLGPRYSAGSFYEWLITSGYPDDLGLAVLCWSCNQASHRSGGVCPHDDPNAIYLTTTEPRHAEARIAWLRQQVETEHQRTALAVGANTTQSIP